eukprot:721344_1
MMNDEPGTCAERNRNIKWINETVTNEMNAHKTQIKIKDMRDQLVDGDVICVQIDVLNKTNQIIQQTHNKYFTICDSVQFVDYVLWEQEGTMSRGEEDGAMTVACASKYNGSRPATYKELFDHKINGLQGGSSDAASHVLFHSGNDDFWKADSSSNGNRRFRRKGWYLSSYPNWNEDNACNLSCGTMLVIAVTESLTAKDSLF